MAGLQSRSTTDTPIFLSSVPIHRIVVLLVRKPKACVLGLVGPGYFQIKSLTNLCLLPFPLVNLRSEGDGN